MNYDRNLYLQHQPNQSSGSSRATIATLKALEYLLKIVVRSRQLSFAAGTAMLLPESSSPPDPSVPPSAVPIQLPEDAIARFAAIKADPQFQSDLLDVFSALNQLMRLKGKTYPTAMGFMIQWTLIKYTYVGAQAAAIKNFASMLEDMEQIFSMAQLANILAKFIDSVQYRFGARTLVKTINNVSVTIWSC